MLGKDKDTHCDVVFKSGKESTIYTFLPPFDVEDVVFFMASLSGLSNEPTPEQLKQLIDDLRTCIRQDNVGRYFHWLAKKSPTETCKKFLNEEDLGDALGEKRTPKHHNGYPHEQCCYEQLTYFLPMAPRRLQEMFDASEYKKLMKGSGWASFETMPRRVKNITGYHFEDCGVLDDRGRKRGDHLYDIELVDNDGTVIEQKKFKLVDLQHLCHLEQLIDAVTKYDHDHGIDWTNETDLAGNLIVVDGYVSVLDVPKEFWHVFIDPNAQTKDYYAAASSSDEERSNEKRKKRSEEKKKKRKSLKGSEKKVAIKKERKEQVLVRKRAKAAESSLSQQLQAPQQEQLQKTAQKGFGGASNPIEVELVSGLVTPPPTLPISIVTKKIKTDSASGRGKRSRELSASSSGVEKEHTPAEKADQKKAPSRSSVIDGKTTVRVALAANTTEEDSDVVNKLANMLFQQDLTTMSLIKDLISDSALLSQFEAGLTVGMLVLWRKFKKSVDKTKIFFKKKKTFISILVPLETTFLTVQALTDAP